MNIKEKMKIKYGRKKFSMALSLLRLIAVPIVFLLLLYDRFTLALILFIIFPLVGFLENFVQRNRNIKSPLRNIIDNLADRLLIDFAAVTLAVIGMFPKWAMIIFVARDAITYIGGALFLMKDKITVLRPSIIGRFTLFFQVLALALAIARVIDYTLIWISVILTIVSVIYILFKSEFIILKRSKELEALRMSKLISLADLFTLGNAFSGFMVILFSINKHYSWAALMMISAVLFDWFDGKVARAINRTSDFGKELDSLADTVSFGVAPAIFAFTMIQTKLAVATFVIFIFCGILRLARFNITEVKGVFQGTPITLNGIVIPLVYFFGVPIAFYPYIFLVLGMLMVSPFRVSKIF